METSTFDDAVLAYEKYCEENNLVFQQPSELATDIDRNYVHLKTRYEDLADYEIATGKIIV